MPWEHEPQATVSTAFSSSLKLSRVLYNSIETRSTCYLFLLENNTTKKKENNNVNSLCSRHLYVNSAPSSVSPTSYTKTIFIRSA